MVKPQSFDALLMAEMSLLLMVTAVPQLGKKLDGHHPQYLHRAAMQSVNAFKIRSFC